MRRLRVAVAAVGVTLALGVVPQPSSAAAPELVAFPGAEGFGAGATGGRGGDVDDRRPRSSRSVPGRWATRSAPEDCRPRTIVFAVSGVIEVPGKHDLELTCGDVTIAGQTAPGAGITVHGRIDGYGADPGGNIIIRHLRLRPPPITDEEGAVDDLGQIYDALQLSNNPQHDARPPVAVVGQRRDRRLLRVRERLDAAVVDDRAVEPARAAGRAAQRRDDGRARTARGCRSTTCCSPTTRRAARRWAPGRPSSSTASCTTARTRSSTTTRPRASSTSPATRSSTGRTTKSSRRSSSTTRSRAARRTGCTRTSSWRRSRTRGSPTTSPTRRSPRPRSTGAEPDRRSSTRPPTSRRRSTRTSR